MEEDRILVHALSFEGAEEDLSGDMDRRICRLEGK
jgi:multicomponent Na+:H+ antiporter subunit E